MSQVVLESVRKVYHRDVVAVNGLDLRVEDGELLVVVGPSGCGKTTMLRLIAGLETPTSGTIRIGNRVVNGVPPRHRDVAMVFQDYALYPHMTVRQNLAFVLKMRRASTADIERRIKRTADLLGIADLLDRRPGAMSGGELQRAAVGRAIIREPACCLFDEPLSNLDPRTRLEVRTELKRLHRRIGTTTIFVTHDQEEAMTLGARLVVMAGGVIQQIGAPQEVHRAPENRFVAGFMGSPPMNFVEGRIEERDGQPMFTNDDGATMPLSGFVASIERAPAGEPIVLGIRPEHLAPARDGGGRRADGSIDATIDGVERWADRVDVLATTSSGARLIARLAVADAIGEPGDPFRFRLAPAHVHLFEPGPFGRRL